MPKVNPEKHIKGEEAELAQILSQYGVFKFAFQPIHNGIENSSFRVQTADSTYALRVYSQERKSDESIQFELSFQDYLRLHGIPIPQIIANKDGKKLGVTEIHGKRWQSILMEYVEGSSVTEKPSHELIEDLATIHARMHMLGAELGKGAEPSSAKWVDLRDSFAAEIECGSIADAEVVDFIKRVASYRFLLPTSLPHSYNHLDVDFDGNVITDGRRVKAIIDFDDLQFSPTVVCLGYSLWSVLSDVGVDAMRHYLATYEKVRPLAQIERAILRDIIFFRNYVIGAVRLALWPEKRTAEDIAVILRLEGEIPTLVL